MNKPVYFVSGETGDTGYYFDEEGAMFIWRPASHEWVAGDEFSKENFDSRWQDGWIDGPFDEPPEGVSAYVTVTPAPSEA